MSDSAPEILTPIEKLILSQALEAIPTDFTDVRDPAQRTVRASFIRRLMFELPMRWDEEAQPTYYQLPAHGVCLIGAIIEGDLFLSYGRRPDGGPLPALSLRQCFIPDTLWLDHACLCGLDLEGSRLVRVSAIGARIDAPVHISKIRSAEEPGHLTGQVPVAMPGEEGERPQEGTCWIDLSYSNIGSLVARECRLSQPGTENFAYALNLLSAHVRGDVFLHPKVYSAGGMTFDRARIDGNLELDGAFIANTWGRSVSGQGLETGGFVDLRAWSEQGQPSRPFYAAGDVDLLSAKIGASLIASGANIRGDMVLRTGEVTRSVFLAGWDNPYDAEDSYHTRVRHLLAQDFRCNFLELWSLRVEGGLDLKNTRVEGALRLHLLAPNEALSQSPPIVNFNDLTVHTLEDERGQGVPEGYRLTLDGLSYQKMDTQRFDMNGKLLRSGADPEEADVEDPAPRLRWLALQYPGGKPTAALFRPGPYDELAKYFRSQGLFDLARAITRRRIELERKLKTHWVLRPFLLLYNWLFDSGLSPEVALRTFFACLLVGWAAVSLADHGLNARPAASGYQRALSFLPKIDPVLVVQTSSVNSVVAVSGQTHRPTLGAPLQPAQAAVLEEVGCGEQIEPLLYTIDLFVPGVELQQREKCEVSTAPAALGWRIASAGYTILGFIVTFLTFLTISGILRRQAEG